MTDHCRGNRLSRIDDVRSLVIFLVVMLHSSVTYSGLGGWYVIENRSDSLDLLSTVLFGLFNSFNQAWFMGILFFFGGYFASVSLSRKGSARFIRDRLLRLGLPLAAFMLVIDPLVLYYLAYPETCRPMGSFPYVYMHAYLGKGMVWSGTGPLWFVETLLLFSFALVAVRRVRGLRSRTGDAPSVRPEPSTSRLLQVILATAAFAFLVRVFLPVGTSWQNLQFCYFPSYIVLFCLGVRGSTSGWFPEIVSGKNRRWLSASLAVGVPVWAAVMIFGGALGGNMERLNGGLTAESAAYCLWESFVAIGMSLGVTAFFRARGGAAGAELGPLSRLLSRNSFSVFFFHPVFLIGFTRLFSGWALYPLFKACFVGLLAWSAAMAFGELVIRRIPGVRNYF